jgi:hypothetical protein
MVFTGALSKPSSCVTRMAGRTWARHSRKLSLANFSKMGIDRDAGTTEADDDSPLLDVEGRVALIPCNKSEMRGRHSLSKDVAGLYIFTISCSTGKDYNNNISTFLRDYNKIGRILREYHNNHSIP